MINYKTLTATTFAIATLSLTGCAGVNVVPNEQASAFTASVEATQSSFANNISVGEVKNFKDIDQHYAETGKVVTDLSAHSFKESLALTLDSAGYLGDNDADYVINAHKLYQDAGSIGTALDGAFALGFGNADRTMVVRYEVVEKATGDVEHVAYVDSKGATTCADYCFFDSAQERVATERAYNSNFEALIKDLNS